MDDKTLTAIISLISVVLGWGLAQGASLVRDWWSVRKMHKGLLTELEDLQNQLQRLLLIHARQIQIYAIKGFEAGAALPVYNTFYKQCFKDAFPSLNRSQRISYQLIHANLDYLNEANFELRKLSEEIYVELRQAEYDNKKYINTINLWGDKVICLYKIVRDVLWHIEYHLHNPKKPAFDIMGKMHESYVKFQKELDDEVNSIIDNAKNNFKKEDFIEIYRPEAFADTKGK